MLHSSTLVVSQCEGRSHGPSADDTFCGAARFVKSMFPFVPSPSLYGEGIKGCPFRDIGYMAERVGFEPAMQ